MNQCSPVSTETPIEGSEGQCVEAYRDSRYDLLLELPELFSTYEREVTGIIQRLQQQNDTFIFPLAPSDKRELVKEFQMALDRGQCFDDERSKQEWTRQAMMILRTSYDRKQAVKRQVNGNGGV